MAQTDPIVEPDLPACPWSVIDHLRDVTPLGRLNRGEARHIFQALDAAGYKVVPKD
jgi:hypothetical protein